MVTTISREAVQDWGTVPNQRASNLDRPFGQLSACRFIPTDHAAVAANPSALLSQPQAGDCDGAWDPSGGSSLPAPQTVASNHCLHGSSRHQNQGTKL